MSQVIRVRLRKYLPFPGYLISLSYILYNRVLKVQPQVLELMVVEEPVLLLTG